VIATGETVSHYRILEKLGGGGMGVVYRAHDEHLDRDVALKVLPAGLLSDETARSRFRREALTLSHLNHPGIAVVHDFDSENGVDFLTMEYVEGETLAAKTATGPLAEAEIINLGTQIAEALEEAHERQIIHRDLKPANVMVTAKGRAKVLDFGLAKMVRPREVDAATASLAESQPGLVVGTVPYMAPEQLQGKVVDSRADIYALGAILYEMATGQRPFPEKQSTPLIASILTEPPQPPRELNGQVSPGLEAIILKALEKDPDQRYQSARDVLRDLAGLSVPVSVFGALRRTATRRRMLTIDVAVGLVLTVALLIGLNVAGLRDRLTGGPSAPKIKSLAVMPLANLSGDPQQEYFADGMTEELITNLAKISSLKVISRTSIMQYKGTKKPLPQIAKELNVDALIEGSVIREGSQVRITAKLIQATTDKNLWAESYQRDLRSVLALQSEIASAIAAKVRAAVTPAVRTRLASARLVNPEAYEAYLKGMQRFYKVAPQDLDAALEYFELALKKDPDYAPAYAGIAGVWAVRSMAGWSTPGQAGPKAKAAALKAAELDSTLAQAHYSLAVVKGFYEWDWAGADVEFKRAIDLNPNYPDTRAAYSSYLMIVKRPEEAIPQIQRALELDPLNPLFPAQYATDLELAGRYDEAMAQSRKALRTSPENPFLHWELSSLLSHKAKFEESVAEMKAYYARDREVQEALTQGYAQSGYRGAMKRAADTLAARGRKTYVLPCDVAALYLWAGEKDQALEWLEKAFEVRDPNLPFVNLMLVFESLRNTPRFQALLRRMNLPE
jgi:serine/threonine protein kinase/tetratricopeptide (TPR) repeat protein